MSREATEWLNEHSVGVTINSGDKILIDPAESLLSETAIHLLKRDEGGKLRVHVVPPRNISLVEPATPMGDMA